MIRTVPAFSPPVRPVQTGRWREDVDALLKYFDGQYQPYVYSYLSNFANAFNVGPQGVGPALQSATTINPSAFIHHVTGTTSVQTIGVPKGYAFAAQLILIADNAAGFSLVTGGNIAVGKTIAQNFACFLAYDPAAGANGLWFPHAD